MEGMRSLHAFFEGDLCKLSLHAISCDLICVLLGFLLKAISCDLNEGGLLRSLHADLDWLAI